MCVSQTEIHGGKPADNTAAGYTRHLVTSPLVPEPPRVRTGPDGPTAAAQQFVSRSPIETLHGAVAIAQQMMEGVSSSGGFVCSIAVVVCLLNLID